MNALLDALAAGDVRGVAAAVLRREHSPCRTGVAALSAAVDDAASMTARSLAHGDVDTARIYAEAWELLNGREHRVYARRARRQAAAVSTADQARP